MLKLDEEKLKLQKKKVLYVDRKLSNLLMAVSAGRTTLTYGH